MSGYYRYINTQIAKYAKTLRKNMTEEERILWVKLRENQLGYKFRRQYVIDNYIVDFICLEKRLIIELDAIQCVPSIIRHFHSLHFYNISCFFFIFEYKTQRC